MIQLPLTKFHITINCYFPFNKEIKDLPESKEEILTKFIYEDLLLQFKKNGLIVYDSKAEIGLENSDSPFYYKLEFFAANVSYIHHSLLTLSPTAKNITEIEDWGTNILAKYGLAANLKISFAKLINNLAGEFITGDIIPGENEDKIAPHFHLVIPNRSGRGSSSVFDIDGPNEHYHIIKGNFVGPPEKKGKTIKGGHTHSINRFMPGLYDTSEAKAGKVEPQVFQHIHKDCYLDDFGNGILLTNNEGTPNSYLHTHQVKGGIVLPSNNEFGKHTHDIIIK